MGIHALWKRGAFSEVESYIFVIPAVLMLCALLAYPIVYNLVTSVSDFDVVTFKPGVYIGFENYQTVLENPHFWSSVKVTLIFLIFSLPLQIVLGFAIAFLLSVEWFGQKLLRTLFIIPMVVTPVVAGGLWSMLLDPMWGYVNYLWSLVGGEPVSWLGKPELAMLSIIIIEAWQWTPFVILMALAGIMSLPAEPIEAALVDGANRFQQLWYVILPLLKPVILATFIVRWLGAIKIFDIIYTTTGGGPGNSTEVLNMHIYAAAFQMLSFGETSAMVTLLIVVTLVFTFFWVRFTIAVEK